MRLAQLLFESGDMQQSLQRIRGIHPAESTPGCGLTLGGAASLPRVGQLADAIASYRRACNLFENYAASHYALGDGIQKNRRTELKR